jgi:hypothetical protein
LYRPGLHGHPEESSDDDDEKGHIDGTEQRAAVVVVDVAGLVLDPIEAVDRVIESTMIRCGFDSTS